jgi:hypothetical protein
MRRLWARTRKLTDQQMQLLMIESVLFLFGHLPVSLCARFSPLGLSLLISFLWLATLIARPVGLPFFFLLHATVGLPSFFLLHATVGTPSFFLLHATVGMLP